MQFRFAHNNINVLSLAKSLPFYEEALGFKPVREKTLGNGARLVFLGDGVTPHQLELTEVPGRTEPYNLGENESHIGIYVSDYDAAHALHERMGCICFENPAVGIYFISDPDGYWIEIIPERR